MDDEEIIDEFEQRVEDWANSYDVFFVYTRFYKS